MSLEAPPFEGLFAEVIVPRACTVGVTHICDRTVAPQYILRFLKIANKSKKALNQYFSRYLKLSCCRDARVY